MFVSASAGVEEDKKSRGLNLHCSIALGKLNLRQKLHCCWAPVTALSFTRVADPLSSEAGSCIPVSTGWPAEASCRPALAASIASVGAGQAEHPMGPSAAASSSIAADQNMLAGCVGFVGMGCTGADVSRLSL